MNGMMVLQYVVHIEMRSISAVTRSLKPGEASWEKSLLDQEGHQWRSHAAAPLPAQQTPSPYIYLQSHAIFCDPFVLLSHLKAIIMTVCSERLDPDKWIQTHSLNSLWAWMQLECAPAKQAKNTCRHFSLLCLKNKAKCMHNLVTEDS